MNRKDAEHALLIASRRFHGWSVNDFLKFITYSTQRTITGETELVYLLDIHVDRHEPPVPTEAPKKTAESSETSDAPPGSEPPPPTPPQSSVYVNVRFTVTEQEDRARFRPRLVAERMLQPGETFDGAFDRVKHHWKLRALYRIVQFLAIAAGCIFMTIAAWMYFNR